ncbi:hypothetical protein CVT26_001011 [Gymnopilus dilepis]|uniref:Nucleolar protein 58 n=1 Tax=Gymnopilus dilepis TaxID=231916 RepID=A0A409Y242_9AGAR|nr:hypothetical protein CVT26_001011 [Gymnopilus dilepis]
MLVLYETAMGYCLFKVTDSAKIEKADLWEEFETPAKASKLLKLKALHRFTSTATAVEDISALQNGKLGKGLKQFLTEEVLEKGKGKESLVVIDPHLGRSITKKLGININAMSEGASGDLWRGIRSQITALLDGLDPKDLSTMSLGLSHSLARFKLKFSPDKVDTMVVQAIALLDDLDKEINIYAMRVKEWYGWHFPEMAKIIVDNVAYAKVIRAMGFRTNAATTDFSSILPEDLEAVLKAAAEISMGTEISDSDIAHINSLCDQVISISQYRSQLAEYLRNRMSAIAPNLTALVGELVGARLISHAGSLLNLAKHPASTIQILGAEKALFRALKTKHDTPKYGLIYHASLIGQAPPKLKGKMARMVATKAALSIRVDALTDADGKSEEAASSIGLENRTKLESRLRALEHQIEGGNVRRFSENGKKQQRFEMTGETKTYNVKADEVDLVSTQRDHPMEAAVKAVLDVKEEKKRAKEERKAKKRAEKEKEVKSEDEDQMQVDGESKKDKKEKKRKRRESEVNGAGSMDVDEEQPKEETEEERKARKKAKKEAKAAAAAAEGTESPKKKKKKSETLRKSSYDTSDCSCRSSPAVRTFSVPIHHDEPEMSKLTLAPPPIVVVTGANGGIGYGCCKRLLVQLCQLNPPDARPQAFASHISSDEKAPAGYKGLTLIMACRNRKRAETARTKLLRWFDGQVETLRRLPNYDEDYVSNFLRNCHVEIEELDLASVSSVLNFSAVVHQKYPYVSHLLCNAGVASFKKVNWLLAIKQLILDPMGLITAPNFYTQHVGEISADNLGWVWQSNVFGHFMLFRELEDLLAKSPFDCSRVVWCSSIEASPKYYDSDDWQLKKSEHSYESSKYQVDLLATTLNQAAGQSTPATRKPTKHFISEPGVCSTSISAKLIHPFLDYIKLILFYVGRFCGSPHHTIDPWKAAIASIHLALAHIVFLPLFLNNDPNKPVRFGAQTGRFGNEYVGLSVVKEYETHKQVGYGLVKKCDDLYESIKRQEAAPVVNETASERT